MGLLNEKGILSPACTSHFLIVRSGLLLAAVGVTNSKSVGSGNGWLDGRIDTHQRITFVRCGFERPQRLDLTGWKICIS